MAQSLEIEFKNLLTKIEYEKIKAHFQFEESDFFLQENHYFDTKKFDLKNRKSALRIRKKENNFELTLKQPVKEGLLETNQIIKEAEAKLALEKNEIPKGIVADLILDMKINPSEIHFFGTLSTRRTEIEYENGILVLDQSSYLNHEDYELEYEVQHREEGQKTFIKLLSILDIPIRKTENKIMRFYHLKNKQLQSIDPSH